MDKFEVGQRVRTKEGQPARILCVDFNNPLFSIVAAVKLNGFETIFYYDKDGRVNMQNTPLNLVPKPYIDITREMDHYIGNLLNETDMTIPECCTVFSKKYPNREDYFYAFVEDYLA